MQNQRNLLSVGVLLVLFFSASGCVSRRSTTNPLRESLTLYASFDHGLNADFAAGDNQLYGAAQRGKPQEAQPGLPEGNAIQLAPNEGRLGGHALRFARKSDATVFFKGQNNFAYQTNQWSGSISFWLKLDPDEDLQPGYCDPVQIASGNWSNGVFFAEFSKDDPRHFRFALRPLFPIWNPRKVGWEMIPVAERPMVDVANPPFGRDRWTHVVFTFENANTHRKDGVGRLFLNGKSAGEFRDWELTVNWNPEQMLVILGAAYVGLLDDLALFNRALTAVEVRELYEKPGRLNDFPAVQLTR